MSSRHPPVSIVHVLHDAENLALHADSDLVRLQEELIRWASHGRPPLVGGGATFTWRLYHGSSTAPTDKLAKKLRIVGADLISCGEKRNAVDSKLKEAVIQEIAQWRPHPDRDRLVVIIMSSDSDFSVEVRALKQAGIRVGVVCKRDAIKEYPKQADFSVLWEDVLRKCSGGGGGGSGGGGGGGIGGGGAAAPRSAARAAASRSGHRDAGGASTAGSGAEPQDALREAWCDAIFDVLLAEDLAEGECIHMASLGEFAAPLRPPGGKSLKLEASLRADNRFVVTGDGPEALVCLRDDEAGALTAAVASLAVGKRRSAAALKGSMAAALDSLAHIYCLWPPGSSKHLHELQQLATGSPVAGLDCESALRRDPRFFVTADGRVGMPSAVYDQLRESSGMGPHPDQRVRAAPAAAPQPPAAPVRGGSATASLPQPSGAWVDAGWENELVRMPRGTRVRYGSEPHWVESTIDGVLPFFVSNDFFGTDPAFGTRKKMQRWQPPEG